ncbi:DUF1634 domain-containing protein [Clostridium felsineum]|uniref:DUF1634 domain-containing protein n=1 Tax=Clostridium felsineum TaxID=36839 RepID=UPI00098C4A2A|nr:DUF1634 domain-containing protein [Clostridium felsineum]URZ01238.1 hypothetical protein CLAUR_012270 [Clostridium felsineum]
MKHNEIEEMELIISKFLMIGVLISALITFVGFIMLVVTGSSGYRGNVYPTSPIKILEGAFELKSYAIILTGLLILIITPVLRVGVSIIVFMKEKDYLYVKITSFVFIILIISFVLGKVE